MENFIRVIPTKIIDRLFHHKAEVFPKRARMRLEQIPLPRKRRSLVILTIFTNKVQALQHKLAKCDNYHFYLDCGCIINECQIDDIKVDITKDKIRFSNPLIRPPDITDLKIIKREEVIDSFGNKLIYIVVADDRIHTSLSLIISRNALFTGLDNPYEEEL